MLVVIIAVAGLLVGPSAAEGQLFGQLAEFVVEDMAKALQGLLGNAQESDQGIVAAVVGNILVVGDTGVFMF